MATTGQVSDVAGMHVHVQDVPSAQILSLARREPVHYSNPNGEEVNAVLNTTDKLMPPNLGGLATSLLSSHPAPRRLLGGPF